MIQRVASEARGTSESMDEDVVLRRHGYIMGIGLWESSYAKVRSAYSERLEVNVAIKITDCKTASSDFQRNSFLRNFKF